MREHTKILVVHQSPMALAFYYKFLDRSLADFLRTGEFFVTDAHPEVFPYILPGFDQMVIMGAITIHDSKWVMQYLHELRTMNSSIVIATFCTEGVVGAFDVLIKYDKHGKFFRQAVIDFLEKKIEPKGKNKPRVYVGE